ALEERVLALLGAGPLDPKQLREGAGDAVRNLGPEGKKRGVTTTLPLVLGSLQSQGRIRRIPITGRLDQERYRYALWEPSPLTACGWSREEALTELARRYFTWIGPATLGQFQWFSGLGVRAAQAAVQPLGLRPVAPGSDWLLPPELEEPFRAYRRPEEPCYALVASLDGIFHLRRDVQSLLGSDLEGRLVPGEGALRPLGGLADLSSHAILDRGELVGIWEFDPGEGRILWQCFRGVCPALPGAIARTEAFVREQLGDARSYSMDTPASREFSLSHLRAAMSAP
ncbi:MAG: winged helix DNA-binding domain-containing protein, partial [Armatimonadetes bacterium]|nr:winged helix DNA-binding domain-containing protein [Armatimonadota bacterium]